ncbi:MAG: RNA polymerase sigma factor [Parasphingopyxis sp.]|uniref:RNA polymerase sigma factor n=1 Tax=Parasphingopyxis sp. TaxID=1920299 RepID=UPI003FA013C8
MGTEGISAVFEREREALRRFLLARGAGEEAEDLLQELWVKLHNSPTGPIADARSYLFRAANNLMIDRARMTLRRKKREQDWDFANHGDQAGVSAIPSQERILISRETLGRVQEALDALGERPAAIFRRHRIDGLSQRAIAEEMGLGLSTVEKDLRKAYRALIDFQTRLDKE